MKVTIDLSEMDVAALHRSYTALTNVMRSNAYRAFENITGVPAREVYLLLSYMNTAYEEACEKQLTPKKPVV